MRTGMALRIVVIGLPVLVGCAGTGEIVSLDVRAMPSAVVAPAGPVLKIAVVPLEDQRPARQRLGVRTHLGGGVTYFDLPGGQPGETVARVIADYLQQKGWQAWVRKAGMAEPEGGADAVLTGQLQAFSANAKSRFGSTEIKVETRFAIQGLNAMDQSTIRMTIDGARTDSVFWFEPRDVEALLNETLRDSLAKLMTDTKVEQRLLRLR